MTKIVKINKKNRDRLKSYSNESINNNLEKLMDTVENNMPFIKYTDEMTSINLSPETVDRLDSFKICNGESRDAIITRLLICYDENYAAEDQYWIMFKITSSVNKKLVLNCMYEYNSEEIVFDEGYGVYGNELPPTYISNGEDLSEEFVNWIHLLDWEEIQESIKQHYNKPATILKQTTYILEIL